MIQLKITNPCDANWEKMTDGKNARFCHSCSKNVMNFADMQKEEIIRFILQNRNKSLCGRMI